MQFTFNNRQFSLSIGLTDQSYVEIFQYCNIYSATHPVVFLTSKMRMSSDQSKQIPYLLTRFVLHPPGFESLHARQDRALIQPYQEFVPILFLWTLGFLC